MFWYGAKCWKLFWNLLITKGSQISLLDISYLRTACMVYVWCSCGCSLNQSIFMHWCLRFWYLAVPLILSFNLATASISRREVNVRPWQGRNGYISVMSPLRTLSDVVTSTVSDKFCHKWNIPLSFSLCFNLVCASCSCTILHCWQWYIVLLCIRWNTLTNAGKHP